MTPSPPDGRTVHVPERGSFFVRMSDGPIGAPTVVLLHGLGATADLNWATTIPALSRHFRVVAPDLRGHGHARTLPDRRFTLEDAADDIAALAATLSLGPLIMVGYSMGGAIAQLVCRRHPALVRGVVLCATSRSFRDTWPDRVLFAALAPIRLASRAIPGDVARALARLIAARVIGDQADVRVTDQVGLFDSGPVCDAIGALGDYRSHGWISTVDVPSAVLVHLRDQIVPPERQFALAHALPRATVYPVDSDHFAVVTAPQAFVSTLVAAARDVQSNDRSAADRFRSW